MRILLLVSSMHGGGAERVAALLTNAWSAHRHQVTLMPTFSGRGSCVYPLDPRARLVFLADVASSVTRAGRLWALRRYIVNAQPDVVVSFLTHVNVAALVATRGTGIPVLVSERTYPPLLLPRLSRSQEWLRRNTYRFAHRVVVQTAQVGEWVGRNCPGARTAIIPNPVTFPMPAGNPVVNPHEALPPGRQLIVAAGRLVDSKRFDVLMEAFARVTATRPQWSLAILGDGPERGRLGDLSSRLGIQERVVFPGFVGNPGDWYDAASVYVLPSSYEGFPNTLVEAMAHGVPAVAFDILTGPRDILQDGALGVLLRDDDHVSRLAAALASLIEDDSKREVLARQSLSVRATYSPERVVGAWNDLLKEAARP